MDRIAALRNVEEALRAFEDGEADLATTEREVGTILRTFATEFETDDRQVYRVRRERGSDSETDSEAASDDGTVVVAESAAAARERGAEFADVPPESVVVESVGE